MAETVYLLCAITSAGCALALLRMYLRRHTRLLLWSSIGFIGIAINNAILVADLVVLPSIDLSVARALVGAVAVLAMVLGLILDMD
jgi:hypothetical protein